MTENIDNAPYIWMEPKANEHVLVPNKDVRGGKFMLAFGVKVRIGLNKKRPGYTIMFTSGGSAVFDGADTIEEAKAHVHEMLQQQGYVD